VIAFGLQEAQLIAVLTGLIALAILAGRLVLARAPAPAGH
jgi:hypothetical protein